METTASGTVDWRSVREEMKRAGVRQVQLARAAKMYHPDVSNILNGRAPYVGPKRTARILEALRELNVDV